MPQAFILRFLLIAFPCIPLNKLSDINPNPCLFHAHKSPAYKHVTQEIQYPVCKCSASTSKDVQHKMALCNNHVMQHHTLPNKDTFMIKNTNYFIESQTYVRIPESKYEVNPGSTS